MKRYGHFLARAAVQITGIVFVTQIIPRVAGITEPKPGLKWVLPASGVVFAASLVYAVVLVVLNVRGRK